MQAAQQVLTPFLQQLDLGGNPFAAAMGGFDPNMMGMDPSMFNNLDPDAMENFMNMMGMDPQMLQGMDPSMMGFDPNAMGMGGGMPFGNPFGNPHQAIDPALLQQAAEYTEDPAAIQRRLANMMHR